MKNVMPQELVLEQSSIVRIRDGKGVVFSIVEGTLWVTQEGDPCDTVLRAGDRLRIERDGLTLAHAIHSARLVIGAHAVRQVDVPSLEQAAAATAP